MEFGTIIELSKLEDGCPEDGFEIAPVNKLTPETGKDSLDSKALEFVLVVPAE